MRRRNFVIALGGAAACPIAARAQQAVAQQPTIPVIGLLSTRAPGEDTYLLVAFVQGLKEAGYVEGENVSIEYRWAGSQYDRLPGAGGRIGPSKGRRDHHERRCRCGVGSKGGNHDDPDRFWHCRRPGQAWSCRQPRSARWQPDRCQFFLPVSWRQSGWNSCVSWCPEPLI